MPLRHLFNTCPKLLPAMGRRHDDVATLVLAAVHKARSAVPPGSSTAPVITVVRERTLGWLTEGRLHRPAPKAEYCRMTARTTDPGDLRPDAYVIDVPARTITPVEFTVPDDVNIDDAIRAKHDKYDIPLRLCVTEGVLYNYNLAPLAVVAIGTWGTTAPETANSLVRIGIPPDAIEPLLRRAVTICMRHNAIIARNRFAVDSRMLAHVPDPRS